MTPLSFQQIHARLKSLQLPEFDLVIGIGSGGIAPATMLACHLNCDLRIITINYRDEENTPRHDSPVLISNLPERSELTGKRLLLVDDVSVSGRTLNRALEFLNMPDIRTLCMKGKADFVLFPEIKDCVKWPWKE